MSYVKHQKPNKKKQNLEVAMGVGETVYTGTKVMIMEESSSKDTQVRDYKETDSKR